LERKSVGKPESKKWCSGGVDICSAQRTAPDFPWGDRNSTRRKKGQVPQSRDKQKGPKAEGLSI